MTTELPPNPAAPPFTPAISVDHVSRWYGNVVAVNDISFALGPGVTGLLGPNGAGKSTLLHMMAGLLAPSAGKVSILGQSAWRSPAIYRSLGLVPEREAVHPYLTGFQFAVYNAELQGMAEPEAAAERAIATVELTDAAHRAIGTSPRACDSGRSSRGRSSTTRRCCSSTSRSTAWTRASGCT